jgi:hypothetical protein
MKNSRSYKIIILAGFIISILFSACKKDKDETGYMQMRMTDTPAAYLHVYVDVKNVEIHRSSSDQNTESGWVSLNTRAAIYDLLTLQNNVIAVLADSTLLPTGKVTQMRLILGSNNSVVLNDNSSHPLTIPSSMNTGIKINLNTAIEPDKTTRILIDFNADKSINLQGDGSYQLTPVIQLKSILTE